MGRSNRVTTRQLYLIIASSYCFTPPILFLCYRSCSPVKYTILSTISG